MKKILVSALLSLALATPVLADDFLEAYRGTLSLGNRPDITTLKVKLGGSTVGTFSADGLHAKKTIFTPAMVGRAGSVAGWTIPTTAAGFTNTMLVGLPASQSSSTLIIPITGLQEGDRMISYTIRGQIESAGGSVTLAGQMRRITAVASDPVDANVGAITSVVVTADTVLAATHTFASPLVYEAPAAYFAYLTGTTAASTDIQLFGVDVVIEPAA